MGDKLKIISRRKRPTTIKALDSDKKLSKLAKDIHRLIDKTRSSDRPLTYAATIGVLEIVKNALYLELRDDE